MQFVRREAQPQAGFSIGVLLNKQPVKGDVGIEIEVEGKRLPKGEDVPPPWAFHNDGSLRGEDNAEYVLQSPLPFEAVPEAVDALWAKFREKNSVIDDSNRTSVHIHLNCQDFHLNRLTAFAALYFTVEDILTHWCGEHRVGNLFCLRAKDAPAIISQFRQFIKSDGRTRLSEHLHYAGLNGNALTKFGSLEIRTLRGVSDPAVILDWIGILERLYKLSGEFKDPRDICALFSAEGPFSFFQSVLGEKGDKVRQDIGWNYDQIQDSMYEGIRLAQDLCYCRDWDLYEEMKLKADPFGRDPRKVLKSLNTQAGGLAAPVMLAQALSSINFSGNTAPNEVEQVPDEDILQF